MGLLPSYGWLASLQSLGGMASAVNVDRGARCQVLGLILEFMNFADQVRVRLAGWWIIVYQLCGRSGQCGLLSFPFVGVKWNL